MLHILTVSDSHSHFAQAIEEYLKRLKGAIEIRQIKPERSENPAVIRRKESLRIREYLEKEKWYVVYCDISAKVLSTEELSVFIEKSKLTHPDVTFLIAGAYGIDDEILKDLIDKRISFSPMTFPHSLALLVLLEQLYRVIQIEKNTGYHH